MAELPTGTVTMLFSDIEGSTLLLSRLGLAYTEALDAQRKVLRKVWAANGGTEMGTEGDSFFVVFATAQDAVVAATQAQRELAGYQWPAGEPIRVRMGIHTGSPTVHDDGYVGMDVHRAARIASAAHGGQVVMSSATAELVNGTLDTGVWVRDLGSHQVKDIPNAERLFQLTVDGLQTDYPALKSLGAASSLPVPTTPLMGRDGELAELTSLLSLPGVRLVTLTGSGGSGKTRLAIAAAQGLVEAFPDGVYFVPLATVTTPEVMWTTIAERLDVPPEGRMLPRFIEHIAHRAALLVLDNLEQLPGADGVVAELIAAAPKLVVIATSTSDAHIW
jgi:class 3 adenylate cyclase